jgi:Spy/CpxP family protein refolding chaperone
MNRTKKTLGIVMLAAAALSLRPAILAADGDAAPAAADMSPTAAAQGSGAHGGGKMMQELGLTGDQATQFKSERKQHRETMMGLRDKLKASLSTLETQVSSKASDSDITATLDALSAARKDMEAEQSRFMAAIKTILNPMQQAQVVLMEVKMMAAEMGGMRAKGGMPEGQPAGAGEAGK